MWEGKKKRNRVGEGKVERAEGVLTDYHTSPVFMCLEET